MKNGIDLIYKLNGNIDEGISVYELSPILLSIGKLINEAHRVLYPSDREVAINIKPFGKGSFEINILMFAKDFIQQALDFLNTDTGKNITLTLAYLGYISQFVGIKISLIGLISSLKGKKIESIEPLKSGELRFNSDDKTSVTVANEVGNLYLNCNIHQYIGSAVVKPLEIPEVISVESFIKHDEEATKVIYKKDIVESIKEYSAQELPTNEPEEVTENKRTIWVHPIKANLEGGTKSWSFRVGKEETLTANITDEIFLGQIKNGDIRLANADRLRVEMVTKQVVKGPNISTINEITKVEEYVMEQQQPKIDFD